MPPRHPNAGAETKASIARNKAASLQQAAAAEERRKKEARRAAAAGAVPIGHIILTLTAAPDTLLRGLVTHGEAAQYVTNTSKYFWPMAVLLLLVPLLWLISGIAVLATVRADKAVHGYIDGGAGIVSAGVVALAWRYTYKYLAPMLKGSLGFTVRKEA